jgi:hypothetical protein
MSWRFESVSSGNLDQLFNPVTALTVVLDSDSRTPEATVAAILRFQSPKGIERSLKRRPDQVIRCNRCCAMRTLHKTKHSRVVFPSRFNSMESVNIGALPSRTRLIEKSLRQVVPLAMMLCLNPPDVLDPPV